MRLFLFIGFLVPVLSYSQIFSNDVISSNGESATIGNVELVWTIGEVAVETYPHAGGSLNEGFHQCLTCVTSSLEELGNEMNVVVFPNPFEANITIAIPGNSESLEIVITDIVGKRVFHSYFSGSESKNLDLNFLETGSYTIQLLSDSQIIKTIKILKQ